MMVIIDASIGNISFVFGALSLFLRDENVFISLIYNYLMIIKIIIYKNKKCIVIRHFYCSLNIIT